MNLIQIILRKKKYIITGLIIIILMICSYFAGKNDVSKIATTKTISKASIITDTSKSASKTTLNDKNTKLSSNTQDSSKTSRNRAKNTVKIKEVFDPTTKAVIERTTTTITDISDSREDNNITNNVESTNIDQSKTTETAVLNTKSETKTETNTITKEETNKPSGSSNLGIAVNDRLHPMITYDIVKIRKMALAGVVEGSIKDKAISGAGAALLLDVKSDRYFVGVDGVYDFKAKNTRVGVCAGMRF